MVLDGRVSGGQIVNFCEMGKGGWCPVVVVVYWGMGSVWEWGGAGSGRGWVGGA